MTIRKSIKKHQEGFSLIETLTVVLVISLVGSIGFIVWQKANTIERKENYKSSNLCQKVSEERNLKPLHNCKESKTKTSSGDEVTYLSMSYGQGMDCPAGCIYANPSFIIDENEKIHEVSEKIENNDRGKIRTDGALISYDCPYNTYANSVHLEEYENQYYWVLTFINAEAPQEFNNTCVINGRIYKGIKDGKPVNYARDIDIKYKNIKSDCSDQDERHERMCTKDYAIMSNNPSLCKNIKPYNDDYDDRNYCYRKLAVTNKDKSLCELVVNQSPETCLSAVEKSLQKSELIEIL